MTEWRAVIFAILVLLVAGPVWAQAVAALSEQQVKSFLAVWSELEGLGQRLPREDRVAGKPSLGNDNPFSRLMKEIESGANHKEFQRIIEGHGYETIQDWGTVAERVMQAYMAVQMDRRLPQLEAEAASLLQKIEENPSISAREKQALIDELQSTLRFANQFQANEAEKAAVRPHMQAIGRVLY